MENENSVLLKKELTIICIIVLFFFLIVARLFYYSIIKYRKVTNIYSNENHENSLQKRANIVDKNGVLIATDVKVKNLFINKTLIDDSKSTAKTLSKILDIKYSTILNKIKASKDKANLILIKKHVLPKEEYDLWKSNLSCILYEDELKRFYPHGNLFSHIVGYTDIDRNGIAGLEKYYDSFLKDNNKQLRLTVDIRLQSILHEILNNAVDKYKANFAVGIISEVKTGNVIASVSIPDFNPNSVQKSNGDKMFNRITYGLYEMGSVFKTFSIAGALENNIVTKNTLFDVANPIKYNSFLIRDENHIKKQTLTVKEIFSQSSNIGTVQIAKKTGINKELHFFENLGLLEKIDTDIAETSLPIQPRIWKEINLYTISYGYGLAITPLHLITATNAILNDGIYISPRFSYEKKQITKRVASSKTSNVMRELFNETIKSGTGKALLDINEYKIGGKSGTAIKMQKDGKYTRGINNKASFIASFPINNPKYTVFVFIDSPTIDGKTGTGSSVGAPVIKEIIKQIIPVLGDV